MGRRSREIKERRARREQDRSGRIVELENELRRLSDGDVVFGTTQDFPEEVRESYLEDVVAFESVSTGTSLFEGLVQRGIDLPPPEKLDEEQSKERAKEVLRALEPLRIALIGFEEMTAREFYSTLWNQTLWEGCYVEKKTPHTWTIIDVSHRMSRSELLQFLEDLSAPESVH